MNKSGTQWGMMAWRNLAGRSLLLLVFCLVVSMAWAFVAQAPAAADEPPPPPPAVAPCATCPGGVCPYQAKATAAPTFPPGPPPHPDFDGNRHWMPPTPTPGPYDWHGGGYGRGWGGGWQNWVAPVIVNVATGPRWITNPMTGTAEWRAPGQWMQAPVGSAVPYMWQPLPVWPLAANSQVSEYRNIDGKFVWVQSRRGRTAVRSHAHPLIWQILHPLQPLIDGRHKILPIPTPSPQPEPTPPKPEPTPPKPLPQPPAPAAPGLAVIVFEDVNARQPWQAVVDKAAQDALRDKDGTSHYHRYDVSLLDKSSTPDSIQRCWEIVKGQPLPQVVIEDTGTLLWSGPEPQTAAAFLDQVKKARNP